jgi:anaerobic ribonucleoside-triphosphate reductase activating protein
MRIAGVITESVVDGLGLRYVIFTQGCPHKCIGCHNLQTHNFLGGYEISIEKLFDSIISTKLISGITLSGGDPFMQASSCVRLVKLLRDYDNKFNVWAYSGYYYSTLLAMSNSNHFIKELLQLINTLVDGPYIQEERDLDLPFRGSRNQNIIHLR